MELLDAVHLANGVKSMADVAQGMGLSARSRVNALLRGTNGALPADEGQLTRLVRALGGGDDDVRVALKRYGDAVRARDRKAPSARSPAEQKVADAVALYGDRALEVYGRLDLEVLAPAGEAPSEVRLPEVFVPPAVRADPPPVHLPRELQRRVHERVRELILRRTHEDADEEVRGAAVEVVGRRFRADEDALSGLIGAATDDPHESVRQHALRVLAEQWAGRPEIRDLLVRSCAGVADGWTRATILRGLAQHWPAREDIHQLLLASADHPHRYTSATLLDELRDHWPDRDDARAVLIRLVTEHEDHVVGSAAVKVLATRWMDRADVGALMLGIAADPSHRYGHAVLHVLCEHWAHREDVRDTLMRAASDQPGKDARAQAVKVLGLRWSDHDGVQELFRRRAVADPDPDVRFSALVGGQGRRG
ncbi:HEAT repeat domain-containing protein [Streptomyces sp. NPDC004658]|uniref:HEAT repeat domain-containing protein n=1 Tax=Streptomyces sp. NPDC004658 TaxID=3154672 RepID=UPI0033BDFFB3